MLNKEGAGSLAQAVPEYEKGRFLLPIPKRTRRPEQTLSLHEASLNPRFEAPSTLLRHGISCLAWAEDALQYYCVRGCHFDLFLLVEDPEAAARCLESNGYSRTPPNLIYQFTPELYVLPRLRKETFGDLEDGVVALLRAWEYRYTLPPASTIKNLIPPLPLWSIA
jgi:hypothetical protein